MWSVAWLPSNCLRANCDAAVNIEAMASDVISGRVEGEESRHTSNFLRLSKTLQGNTLGHLFQILVAELRSHVRLNKSGTDGVNCNPTGRKFLGIAHAHGNDTTLGGGVVGLARVSDLTNDTRDIDDAASTLLGGELEESLGAVEDASKVGVDDRLPLRRLHPHDKSVSRDTSIVDQDVAGSVLLLDLIEHSLDGIRVRD